jgi:hypothetical protein
MFRQKSLLGCRSVNSGEGKHDDCGMEFGLPMYVQRVARIMFDRFYGFLGLPC